MAQHATDTSQVFGHSLPVQEVLTWAARDTSPPLNDDRMR